MKSPNKFAQRTWEKMAGENPQRIRKRAPKTSHKNSNKPKINFKIKPISIPKTPIKGC
jgi:hypothetical protein